MRAAANIGGHPIHPMLISFPIGLWSFALVADLMFLWRDNPAWTYVAYYCLGAGCICAVIAAVFGLIDFMGIKDKEAYSKGALHAAINVIALLIFAIDFYLRTTGGRRMVGPDSKVPLLLSIIGVAAIVVSGWLGGELVFRYGLGVNGRPEGRVTDAPAAE